MYKFTGISISLKRGIKKKRVNESSIEEEIHTNGILANESRKDEEIYTNEAYSVKYKGEARSRGLLEKVPLIT